MDINYWKNVVWDEFEKESRRWKEERGTRGEGEGGKRVKDRECDRR